MPDLPRDRSHIYLDGGGEKQPYVSPRIATSRLPPERNRASHSQALLRAYSEAVQEATQHQVARQKGVSSGAPGLYLEFDVPKQEAVALDALENRTKGIELLSARQSEESPDLIAATVFVPPRSVNHFIERIEQYQTQTSSRSGRPRHAALVARIEGIRAATVKSLFTDPTETFPTQGYPVWWEVWARKQVFDDLLAVAERLQLRLKSPLSFPERIVTLTMATLEQMSALVWNSDAIAELRLAKDTPSTFLQMASAEQSEWLDDLRRRLQGPISERVAICILDGGINNAHPLITPFLIDADLHSYNPSWGVADDDGHGTGMAGLALFGDLTPVLASTSAVTISHILESVKVLPPAGQNEPDAYGYITRESIARAEVARPDRERVVCMAITSDLVKSDGRPTLWSAEIDQLCYGEGDDKRLILLSAGNVRDGIDPDQYPSRNDLEPAEDPAQAWNAVTIGAYTEKCVIYDDTYDGWQVIAPVGDLSPTSRTSVSWSRRWPVKPDVVLEGGNYAHDGAGLVDCIGDLCLLSTEFAMPPFFTNFSDTSAATALAAKMAATVMVSREGMWPETIRALLIHSAEWTPAMKSQLSLSATQQDKRAILRRFGYGVPSLRRAMASAANDLTLVVEDQLTPFDRAGGQIATRDMNIHRFPWPRAELESLGDKPVELRVTLSYFIEPNPGERGWTSRHRYASHGLRFDVKRPLENDQDFQRRINKAAWEAGERPDVPPTGAGDAWYLGEALRNSGSVHSDYWIGTGAELSQRDAIGVYPVTGWWKEKRRLERWGQLTRYSLLVTIRTTESIDIHTPVLIALSIPVPVT
jgi:hypothetical protein